MPALTQTEGLTDVQREILSTVRAFVDAEIIPVASELDRSDITWTRSRPGSGSWECSA